SLSHRMQTIDMPDLKNLNLYEEPLIGPVAEGEFQRYKLMPDGKPSPRSIPGTPGAMYRAGGLEHDEVGNPNFEPAMRTAMVERRRQRMHAIIRDFQEGAECETTWGNGNHIGVMSWGSTASTVREVLERFAGEGLKMACHLPGMVWPLPDKSIRRFLASGIK